MNVKDVLKDYMAIVAIKNKDNFYELVFKKSKPENKRTIECIDILKYLGLPNHRDYSLLFKTKEQEWLDIFSYRLEDNYIEVGHSLDQHYKKSFVAMKTSGLRLTSALSDLKQYLLDYNLWLESYISEVSPKLQEKVDSIVLKNMDEDDVNLLLGC